MKRVTFAAAMLACAIAWASGCSDDAKTSTPSDDAGAPTPIPRPDTNDPQVLAGWQAVVNRACPTCHQSPDASDGILSGAIAPQPSTMEWPKNLTPDPDTGIDAWDAATITTALRTGVDDEGETLCPTMPRFADMKDEEALAIAAYLRSLPAVHHFVPESVCPPIKRTDEDDGGEDDGGNVDDAASDAGSDAPADG